MNVGQLLSIRGPIPKYRWEENKYIPHPPKLQWKAKRLMRCRHDAVGLIAGGTGITPCYQLIKAIFKNPDDKTKVTLVYGNISPFILHPNIATPQYNKY
jgi:cytochrome-b5 reductase